MTCHVSLFALTVPLEGATMPIMSALESGFCRSAPWRVFARRRVLRWALQGHALSGQVLELGAGSGAMAEGAASTFPEARLTVTDLDPTMVRSARERLRPYPNVEVIEADITRLAFEDGSFDIVTSNLMLHHVVDWPAALDEAKRVLRPGGLLLGYDLTRTLAAEAIHFVDRSPHRLIKADNLAAQLVSSGFNEVAVDSAWRGHVMRFSGRAPSPAVEIGEDAGTSR